MGQRLAASIACLGAGLLLWVSVTASAQNGLALRSPAFAAGGAIPVRFSCQGDGLSPPLEWSGVPQATRSLALIVDDPDAPHGTFTHWVVYDLPADTRGLTAGAAASGLPDGAHSARNSAGKTRYYGVCPPSGAHHYVFKLYALDRRLTTDIADKAALLQAMHGHVVARTQMTATYRRR